MEVANYIAISFRAARDLETIREFSIERWGCEATERYFDAFEEALQRLREDSSLLRLKPKVSRHFHFYRVREHFLICILVGSNIYVLAVKHGSMDLPGRLAELEPKLLREAELLHNRFLANQSKRI